MGKSAGGRGIKTQLKVYQVLKAYKASEGLLYEFYNYEAKKKRKLISIFSERIIISKI
jgi:hypothetical protein